jgi:flagellar basal body-associated protein FliL
MVRFIGGSYLDSLPYNMQRRRSAFDWLMIILLVVLLVFAAVAVVGLITALV